MKFGGEKTLKRVAAIGKSCRLEVSNDKREVQQLDPLKYSDRGGAVDDRKRISLDCPGYSHPLPGHNRRVGEFQRIR